jgi:DNA-binding XRE family transcriptional regulator
MRAIGKYFCHLTPPPAGAYEGEGNPDGAAEMSELKKMREDLELSQAEMAKLMETTERKICSIEGDGSKVSHRPAPHRYKKLLTMFHRFGVPGDFK